MLNGQPVQEQYPIESVSPPFLILNNTHNDIIAEYTKTVLKSLNRGTQTNTIHRDVTMQKEMSRLHEHWILICMSIWKSNGKLRKKICGFHSMS